MTIKTKLVFLTAELALLLGGMILLSFLQSRSTLNRQVIAAGTETATSSARELDQYFEKLEAVTLNAREAVAELAEVRGWIDDDVLQPLMVRLTEANRSLGVLDLYMGLEADGRLADGTNWQEPGDYDARSRSWYQEAVRAGKPVLTEPYLDGISKKLVVAVAVPVTDRGGRRLGVLAIDVDLGNLSKLVTSQRIFGTGFGYLVGPKGIVLAHPKGDIVLKENVTVPSAAIPPALAATGRRMVARETGYGDYTFDGVARRIFFAPTSRGPVVGIVFPHTALSALVNAMARGQILAGSLALLVLLGVMILLGRSIVRPIRGVSEVLERTGNLDLRFDESKAWLAAKAGEKTEIGLMVRSLAAMIVALHDSLGRIRAEADRTGASAESLAALSQESLASMEEVKSSVDQVVSLSQSNSAALQQTNAGVEEVSSGASTAAAVAQEGAEASGQTSALSLRAEAQMDEMVVQMDQATEKSRATGERIRRVAESVSAISGFVATIRSIADQTNLLALNAAIEAARAGETGRGFAVVAEEVRKLAEESSDAAKEVETLIGALQEETGGAMNVTKEAGQVLGAARDLVKTAQEGLREVLSRIARVNEAMQNIAATSEEQAAASEEMASGIDQVTQDTIQVVGTLDAIRHSTEETGRASEQVAQESQKLSLGAQALKEELARFTPGFPRHGEPPGPASPELTDPPRAGAGGPRPGPRSIRTAARRWVPASRPARRGRNRTPPPTRAEKPKASSTEEGGDHRVPPRHAGDEGRGPPPPGGSPHRPPPGRAPGTPSGTGPARRRVRAPHGHADADLPGALRHRHQHDVHDADAPHQEGHGGHRRQEHREGAGGGLGGLQDLREVPHREVPVLPGADPVPPVQELLDLGLGGGEGLVAHRPDREVPHLAGKPAGEEAFLGGGDGHHQGVVLVVAPRGGPLAGQQAHHHHGHLVDPHGLAHRVLVPEEVLRHGLPQQGHLGGAAHIRVRQVPPRRQGPLPHLQEVLRGPHRGGGPVLVAHHQLGGALHPGSHRLHGGALPQDGLRVPQGEAGRRPGTGAQPPAGDGAGDHHQQVAAHAGDLLRHPSVRPGAHGEHGDHRPPRR